jgi:hypothetical protein
MRRGHCADCGTVRPFRQAFGWGTFFAVVCTGTLWLLALPFCPLRCGGCGRKWADRASATLTPAPKVPARPRTVKDWTRLEWVGVFLILGLMVTLLVMALLDPSGR